MPKRSSTRKPKEDFSQAAFRIVQELTSEKPKAEATLSSALEDADVRKEIMREMGKRGGQKGGRARAAVMTPEKRSEIAKKAASARWTNHP
jgi:general stress protein YciG